MRKTTSRRRRYYGRMRGKYTDESRGPMTYRRYRGRNVIGRFSYQKLRGTYTLTAASTNLLAAFRINRPDLFDGSSASVTDWSSFSNIYDQYRVMGIKIKWIPLRPNDASSSTNYQPLYVFADFDSPSLTLTDAQAVAYDNLRVYDMTRPFNYFIRIPKAFNSAGTTQILPGFFDTLSTRDTGSIYMQSQNSALTNQSYGRIIITYYIKFAFRR